MELDSLAASIVALRKPRRTGRCPNGHRSLAYLSELRLGFVRRFLLLCLRCPGGNNAVHPDIGDGLAQMLAHMTRDHEERSALRGFAPKHFLRLVRIGVAQSKNGFAKM